MDCPFKVGDIIEFEQSRGYFHFVTKVKPISYYNHYIAIVCNSDNFSLNDDNSYAYMESDTLISSMFREE